MRHQGRGLDLRRLLSGSPRPLPDLLGSAPRSHRSAGELRAVRRACEKAAGTLVDVQLALTRIFAGDLLAVVPLQHSAAHARRTDLTDVGPLDVRGTDEDDRETDLLLRQLDLSTAVAGFPRRLPRSLLDFLR